MRWKTSFDIDFNISLFYYFTCAAYLFAGGKDIDMLNECGFEVSLKTDLAVDLDLIELFASAHDTLLFLGYTGYDALSVEHMMTL